MRKINLRKEKAIKNEEYADQFKRYRREDRKKLRAVKIKKREEAW